MIPQGRYTYRGKDKFAGLALQLRIEPKGAGIMVINANTVLFLNETASAYAYWFMKGKTTDAIIREVTRQYRVDAKAAKKDFEKLVYTISTLAHTEKICPMTFLDVRTVEPFSQELSAPLRMDLALTFRCQNDCVHCYAGCPRETGELKTAEWKTVIDRLHETGVFIITFTGGEPTLREDLPQLLLYAQNKGIVTGLISNGRRLADKSYVETLEKAGLDFVQITLESRDPKIHDRITGKDGSWKETVEGIRNAVCSQIYTTTNTTLNQQNAAGFLETLDFVKELGVKTFGCNSLIYSGKAKNIEDKFALSTETLNDLLPEIRDKANRLRMKFLWYTPTQYCNLDPVKLGLGVKSCTAANFNMCIGPDGTVYLCQSYFEGLGNILENDWSEIWNHPLALKIRKRQYVEAKCRDCPQLYVCGGGCPLELQSKGYMCAESE